MAHVSSECVKESLVQVASDRIKVNRKGLCLPLEMVSHSLLTLIMVELHSLKEPEQQSAIIVVARRQHRPFLG